MRGRIRGVSCHRRADLASEWMFCSTPAAVIGPDKVSIEAPCWQHTHVPTTAAAALRALGQWSLESPAARFDDLDWWFRCRFAASAENLGNLVLGFDGLATIADVWLNGTALFSNDNMFVGRQIALPTPLPEQNELLIRFRSLSKSLEAKRPRPKWRVPMIEQQQLRWFRTTLLGRTPGWSPPVAPVGPWKPVWLEERRGFDLQLRRLRASVTAGRGIIDIDATLAPLNGASIQSCHLEVARNGEVLRTALIFDGKAHRVYGSLTVEMPTLWWPHTHGEPALYSVRMTVEFSEREDVASAHVDLGKTGFRTVELDTADGNFGVRINGIRIFCRGACWTPQDVVSLQTDATACRESMAMLRDAGMNMLRLSGALVYESDDFLDACDEQGVLLWHDFMFANMDYPAEDAGFLGSVELEVRQQLARLMGRPSVAVLCGNSEVEQQAAMWGASRDRWEPELFHRVLPELIASSSIDVPYWPSSAHGGAFPHEVRTGTTSYYGVGAYCRPLEDARRSEVKFATESLAFANVPEDDSIARMPNGLALRWHHPEWKRRVPRDLGAGWDFEDIRDFYTERLTNVHLAKLRYADHDRFLQLSRVSSGEVMAATFAEWRRRSSGCNGALIWFLRDLWEGAGWGVLDAAGHPKAAFYLVRRALQPVGIFITDEGCNCLQLHIVNDRGIPLVGTLQFTLYRHGETVVFETSKPVHVPAHEAIELAAAMLMDGFQDLSYAFRFGPPTYDVAVASLTGASGLSIAEAVHFVTHPLAGPQHDVGLTAIGQAHGEQIEVHVTARCYAHAVCVQVDGYRCSDQYFNVFPGGSKLVTLMPTKPMRGGSPRGSVVALNGIGSSPIAWQP